MLTPVINGLGWTFDTVASTYEKMRPGYSDELYDAIFDYIPIGEESHAMEVGIGGGQATLPVLKTGCRLTAVDPGEKFSALCRDKFRAFSKFSVITGKFEEVSLEENACDLVFSASAFHWVPEEEGYQKVFRVLKSGGAFARFANHPYRDKGKPALSDDIDALYARYYSTYHKKAHKPPVEYTEAESVERADIAKKYGFTDVRYAMFYRTRTFTAQEYVQLLGTYSDHIAIEETIRSKFFAGIAEAINDHGGTMTIYDTMDLQLARKP